MVDEQFNNLILRIRAGRRRGDGAGAPLRERHPTRRAHPPSGRALRRVLDSMDICQSVLASFFIRTALGQYELDSPEQLLHLLTSITRNKLINQAKRLHTKRRDISRVASIGDDTDRVLDQASDPSEQASAKEILEKVRARLTDDERFLAEQRALGRGWKEIAAEVGGTDVALRKKLTRALDRITSELGLDEELDV